MRASGVHTAAQMRRDPPDHRYLYRALQRAADYRSPRQHDSEVIEIAASAEPPQGGNHRGVPHDRRRIRQEKAAMTVQDAETPGRQDQQSRTGKQDAHDVNGQFPFRPNETGSENAYQQWCGYEASQDENSNHQGQDGAYGAG